MPSTPIRDQCGRATSSCSREREGHSRHAESSTRAATITRSRGRRASEAEGVRPWEAGLRGRMQDQRLLEGYILRLSAEPQWGAAPMR